MNIDVSSSNMKFLTVFSSESRIKIIEMLNDRPMNIKDIAEKLRVSSAIVTKHIQRLESVGIVKCENIAGKRGMQKICTLYADQAVINFKYRKIKEEPYSYSIPVGQYSMCNVKPTCGLAYKGGIIGIVDDPRYFADTEHIKASMLWFGSGWVEYCIPNYILSNQTPEKIEISIELCSEAPGYNENWPSDIDFFINNINVGMWTSPGDFGSEKGIFTPAWWKMGTQHGLIKTISVNCQGSFIDGIKTSDVKISDLNIAFGETITIKIANLENSKNIGGVSIFGKDYGNYNQDINVSITVKGN